MGGGDVAGLLDNIEEEVAENAGSDTDEPSDNDGAPDDKYDPLSKNKEGAPKLKK